MIVLPQTSHIGFKRKFGQCRRSCLKKYCWWRLLYYEWGSNA